jgi:hypothetical protein
MSGEVMESGISLQYKLDRLYYSPALYVHCALLGPEKEMRLSVIKAKAKLPL